jgi:hypothetical protein
MLSFGSDYDCFLKILMKILARHLLAKLRESLPLAIHAQIYALAYFLITCAKKSTCWLKMAGVL